MSSRTKKFLSYYKPYLGLFSSVMFSAILAAGITLLIPLCTRYITKTVLENGVPDPLGKIYRVGALMLLLILIHTAANYYVDYRGHVMGARMEQDMRSELFDHYQKLSFRFYDEQRTGQLMSRITTDLLSQVYWRLHNFAWDQCALNPGSLSLSADPDGVLHLFQ